MAIVGNPVWMDDFLGISIDPKYAQSFNGTGSIGISSSPSVSGAVELSTAATGLGNMRLRFGEEPVTGKVDARNWNATNGLTYEARVFFNNNQYTQGTVGFVGVRDPNYVLAAIYDAEGTSPATWKFQLANFPPNAVTLNTTFTHTPGTWATFRITTTGGQNNTATLYINDVQYASYTGNDIPTDDICTEFQVWNRQISGSNYSQVSMWVDYLYVTQSR